MRGCRQAAITWVDQMDIEHSFSGWPVPIVSPPVVSVGTCQDRAWITAGWVLRHPLPRAPEVARYEALG